MFSAQRTKLMLDCFRTGGANSPETFVTAVAATLARYPDQVIYEVTDPLAGLPSQLSWMPTIKDVHDACERAMIPINNAAALKRDVAAQMEARRQEDEAKQHRPTVAELKAKYGENWGMTSLDQPKKPPMQAPTIEQLRHHYKHYDLEFKPKTELEEHIDAGFSPSTI